MGQALGSATPPSLPGLTSSSGAAARKANGSVMAASSISRPPHGGWDYPSEFSDAFLYYPGAGTSPCHHVDAIKELLRYLASANIPPKTRAQLLRHLRFAKACLETNRLPRACHHLQNFQRENARQLGKRFPGKARLLRVAAADLLAHLSRHLNH